MTTLLQLLPDLLWLTPDLVAARAQLLPREPHPELDRLGLAGPDGLTKKGAWVLGHLEEITRLSHGEVAELDRLLTPLLLSKVQLTASDPDPDLLRLGLAGPNGITADGTWLFGHLDALADLLDLPLG